jgi:hypothetical protein
MLPQGQRAHIEAMNTQTTRTQDLPGRPVRGKLDQETIVNSRTSPWEPGANAGAPKVLVGLVGAALVGAVALSAVLMSSSPKGVKHATTDQVAAAQVGTLPASGPDADMLAARVNNEPPAAGTNEPAPATQSPAATTPGPAPAPTDTTNSSSTPRQPTIAPPVLPQPETTEPAPPRTPGATTPTRGE